jgi:hypothetical protein
MRALILVAVIGLAVVESRAEHSKLPPRAEQLFGHMKQAMGGPDRVAAQPSGPVARSPLARTRPGIAKGEADPASFRPGVYTGRNPLSQVKPRAQAMPM